MIESVIPTGADRDGLTIVRNTCGDLGIDSAWLNQVVPQRWGSKVEPEISYADRMAGIIAHDIDSPENWYQDFRKRIETRRWFTTPVPNLSRAMLDMEFKVNGRSIMQMQSDLPDAVARSIEVRIAAIMLASGGRASIGSWGWGKPNNDGAVDADAMVRTVKYMGWFGFAANYMPMYAVTNDLERLEKRWSNVIATSDAISQLGARVVLVLNPVVDQSDEDGRGPIEYMSEKAWDLAKSMIGNRPASAWLKAATPEKALVFCEGLRRAGGVFQQAPGPEIR